jgi:hypothetical protein
VTALFMAVALVLARDLRFAALAVIALVFAAVLAGWPEGGPFGFRSEAVGVALAVACHSVGLWIAGGAEPFELSDAKGGTIWRERRIGVAGWSLFGAAALAVIALAGPGEAWRGPIAAGLVSIVVWGVKEFGSDLPAIHLELEEARLENGTAAAASRARRTTPTCATR